MASTPMKILQIFSTSAKISGFSTILQVIMVTPSTYSVDSDPPIEASVAVVAVVVVMIVSVVVE